MMSELLDDGDRRFDQPLLFVNSLVMATGSDISATASSISLVLPGNIVQVQESKVLQIVKRLQVPCISLQQ